MLLLEDGGRIYIVACHEGYIILPRVWKGNTKCYQGSFLFLINFPAQDNNACIHKHGRLMNE